MPLALTSQPNPSLSTELAVIHALTYSDIFDFPLRLEELHRFLPVRAELEDLPSALRALNGQTGSKEGFYFLAGRETIVETRKEREKRSRRLLPHAIRYGRMLGSLPFVRMVALTGSLAVMNPSLRADFDYLLVAAKGRVWTARAFALLLNRFAHFFGHTLCPNLILSESALEWRQHDLYSAHELVQMLPITGMDVYRQLMEANRWTEEYLPNYSHDSSRNTMAAEIAAPFKPLFELPLRGRLGDHFEYWEMNRKIARFSKQPGFGEETIFTAEVCQGNFHHHRKWTHELFQQKLNNLSNSPPLPQGEGLEVRAV